MTLFKHTFGIVLIALLINFSAFSQVAIAYSSLVNNDMEIRFKSGTGFDISYPLFFSFGASEDSLSIPKNRLMSKFGFTWNQLYFKENYIFSTDDNSLNVEVDQDPAHVYKDYFFRSGSSLRLFNLKASFLYVRRAGVNNHFSFGAGGELKYLLGGSFIRRYEVAGERVQVKDRFSADPNYFYFNRFNYGGKIFVSYKWLMLFAIYDFRPIFKADKAPKLNMFTFGLYFNYYWKTLDNTVIIR